MNDTTEPISQQELRIAVEMGDEYVPSARLAEAINELAAALEAESSDDVDGFGAEHIEVATRNFSFMGNLGEADFSLRATETSKHIFLEYCKMGFAEPGK